jgi:uncharacterized protein (DUF488 family)
MPRLYTIGYEGLSLEQFIGKLRNNHIQALIDVRELPLSRKPGFSKTKLSEALENVGIQYQSVRDLGSPRKLRHEFRDTNDWDDFSTQFLEHLQGQRDLLEALVEQAYEETVCLMCFEHDSTRCHRSIVAERVIDIADNGLSVRNL